MLRSRSDGLGRDEGSSARCSEPRVSELDVLIVTALPEEHDAARDAALVSIAGAGVAAWREMENASPTPYLLGDYIAVDGGRMTIALARPARMGGLATTPIAATLAARLKPRCLAMCGVCAGNPDDVALGDVVIADMVYQYDEGKRTRDGFEGDHRQVRMADAWVRAAQELRPAGLPSFGDATEDEATRWLLERLHAGDDPRRHPARARYFPKRTWEKHVRALESAGHVHRAGMALQLTDAGRALVEEQLFFAVDGPERLPFEIWVGPIASGNVVVKDGVTWESLKRWGVRSVLGLEMEAAAIGATAHGLAVPNWAVAKGVMDHADPRKDDRYKRFAARASAEVLLRFLAAQFTRKSSSRVDATPTVTALRSELDRKTATTTSSKNRASSARRRRPSSDATLDRAQSGDGNGRKSSAGSEAEPRRGPAIPADDAPPSPIPIAGGSGSSVFLYRSRVDEFARTVKDEQMTRHLQETFAKMFGHNPGGGEVDAWESSLAAMANLLECDALLSAYVFVEFKMPMSSARCDLIVVGNDVDGTPHAVVIELKQWSEVTASDVRNTVMSHGRRYVHPSVQVSGYCQYLHYYHQAFTECGVKIDGCAFLHRMQDPSSIKLLREARLFQDLPKDYPVFVHGDLERLQQFISEKVGHGGGDRIAELLSEGSVRPATELLNYVNQAIQSQFEWTLLDEQREAFDLIISKVEASRGADIRSVVIVRGGPGTGKSVLAIQLLAYGAQNHWRVAHTTGSKAFRTVLQAATQDSVDQILMKIHSTKVRGKLPVKELFTLSAEIARLGSTKKDVFDLVVYDEAHRLWDYRRRIFQNMNKKLSDVPMIEELMNSTKVAAFFLDEHQTVRAHEIGSVEHILEHAFRLDANVEIVDLNSQFRCAGSAAYIEWIEHVLGFEGSSSTVWRDVDGYQFDICDSMQQLQGRLDRRRAAGYKCRLVAGFCWPWSKMQQGEPLPRDIRDDRFDGWSAPWIEKSAQDAEPSEHRYTKWAQDAAYYHQVGSIYSAQGFEFDYVGLIFGEDLLYRKGRWEACLDHSHDQQLKIDLKNTSEDPTARIRNIYRVLLTRGMRGTSVFFLDRQTRERFELILAG